MPVRLSGATSGYVELAAPAVAGTTVLELPTDSIKPGLVLVAATTFTAASTVNVDGCFTADYDNYFVHFTFTATAASTQFLKLRNSGVDLTSSTYQYGSFYYTTSALAFDSGSASAASAVLGYSNVSVTSSLALEIRSPALASVKRWTAQYVRGNGAAYYYHGNNSTATAHDGFTYGSSSGTITGSLAVYGYRKAL